MRIELNLASRPLVNHLPHLLLLGVLAAAALGLTAWNLTLHHRTRAEARAVESQLAALGQQEDRLEAQRAELLGRLRGVDLDWLSERTSAANTVLARRTLSWSVLLQRLQELLPWHAKLESIRTTVRSNVVSLTLEMKTREYENYLKFLDDLEDSTCFSNAYSSSETWDPEGEFEVTIVVDHDPWCGEGGSDGLPARGSRRRSRG